MKILEPINTDREGNSFTVTARYGAMCSNNVIGGGHYPMTAVCERSEFTPPLPQNLDIMKHPKIIQKFGDRKGPDRYSVSDMAHTIPANPMSDRGQLLVEPCILRPVRTELAKELRRQGVERFANRQMQPRTDGISNTLTSVEKDNYLYEPITCASRKRGDVHKLGTGSVIANCLTSIDTDSMVAETLISVHPLSHALEFNGDKSFKEILPTLRATDYKCPNVVLTKQKSDMRKEVEKNRPIIVGNTVPSGHRAGAVFDTMGGSPTVMENHGKIIKIMGNDNIVNVASRKRGEAHNLEFGADIANAITSINTDSMVAKPQISVHPLSHKAEFSGFKESVSPALRATDYKAPHCIKDNSTSYRIRKLTPKECFRLMDVDDADIDKIQAAGISKSQQYKLAGNSIVTSCLYHIFRQMFTDIKPNKSQQPHQLSLF